MKKKNSLSFKVFPGGQPGKYNPRPKGFDLGHQTNPTFFPVVYSYTGDLRKSLPY